MATGVISRSAPGIPNHDAQARCTVRLQFYDSCEIFLILAASAAYPPSIETERER
jgi:hypothetical protein